jgi:CDP-diacylglycerol--glycerol-3-phosphate 3-phosphatidyltransferase
MNSAAEKPSVSAWNVPNLLTTARLVLSCVVFALVAYRQFLAANLCFLVAASTDWIDGYWARKYGQVTKLGRIFDPFVDKIIICGAFIALVPFKESGVAAWMAIVVVGRELLVTSLRGLIEGSGGDFSARQLGKWKMVLQCGAVVAALICLSLEMVPGWMAITRTSLLWAAIGLTLYSGIEYVVVAVRVLRSPPAEVN